jgi:hypothetical protein
VQPGVFDDLLDLTQGEYDRVLALIHHEQHRRQQSQRN